MRLPALVLFLGVLGCHRPVRSELTWSVVVTGKGAGPHRGGVRLMMEEEAPPSTFTELGLIQVAGTLQNAEPEIVQHHLQLLAARFGCDTVIRVRLDEGAEVLSATGVCGRASLSETPRERDVGASEVGIDSPAGALPEGHEPPAPGTPEGSTNEGSTPGGDTMTMKTGEVIHGTISVVEPSHRVVILDAASGAPVTVPWTEIEKVDRRPRPGALDETGPGSQPDPPVPAAPPLRPPSTPGVVRVHIETENRSVQLRRHLLTSVPRLKDTVVLTDGSEFICKAPCDLLVDGRMGQEYFFTGSWMPPSSRFQMVNMTGDLAIPVKAGNIWIRQAGIGVTVAGAVCTAGAIPGTIVAYKFDMPSPLRTIALIGLVTNAVALATGIVLVNMGSTDYSLPHGASAGGLSPRWASLEGLQWHF